MITITISNWKKYNPRTDKANYSWFRFENNFFADPHVFSMCHPTKLLFIMMLCEASKVCSDNVQFNIKYAAQILGITTDMVIQCLQSLIESGVILTSDGRPLDVKGVPSRAGDERTNERTYIQSPNGDCSVVAIAPPKLANKRQTITVQTDQELGEAIPEDVWIKWAAMYSAEYLAMEGRKAVVWLIANPDKAKKTRRGWIQFMAGWFDRGWDKSRTRGPSLPTTNVDRGTDWISLAERVIGALRFGTPVEREKAIGPQTYALAVRVGWHNIGQLDRRFAVKTLAGQLRAEWENQTKGGTS